MGRRTWANCVGNRPAFERSTPAGKIAGNTLVTARCVREDGESEITLASIGKSAYTDRPK